MRVVMFELNEVPWRILDWYADRHPGSTVARLRSTSAQWTSVAADQGHLSPWVTWPTVHRGVPDTQHGIGHFGQSTGSADDEFPTYWRLAVDAGKRVGVFSVLHSYPLPADVDRYAFWVPDPFAEGAATHPASVEPFQAFNLAMSRASARNVSTGIDWTAARRFLLAAPRLGVRPSTLAAVVRQLADERRRPETRVRRRTLQPVIGFDIFDALWRRTRPDLAVLFTNHVASAMHRYWAASFPDDFEPDEYHFEPGWARTWDAEIEHALGWADRMLARLVAHADADPSLVLVVGSSMGQAAWQGTPVGRQLYLRDPGRLLAAAGVSRWERRPAMDPQVNVVAADPDPLIGYLGRLRICGLPIDWHREDGGFVSMSFGQADDAIGDVTVDGTVVDPASLGMEIVEIEDEVASTGYHVPEGSLLAYGRSVAPDATRSRIPTTAIAPALLDLLGVAPAPHHAVRDLTLA